MRPALEVSGLRVRYRELLALDDVDLVVPRGRAVGLVGVNGSGKSTLFKAAVGLVRSSTGTVRVLGGTVEEARARGLLGYVPQSGDVDPDFPVSVADVVLMGRYPHRHGRPRPADHAAARAALERMGTADLAGRPFGRLSGGQRQRVMLARALTQDAHLLLLDEPFTGVDPGSQAIVTGVLRDLVAQGRSVLLSSHDLTVIPELCSSVVLLNRRVLATGPPGEVLTPQNLAASFGLDGGLA